jgi:cathepsin B
VLTTAEEIKRELRENGPMMMGLEIYEDFMNYKSGIYKQVTGENIGGHAMKLIGYGEDPVEGLFWVLQN